MCVAQYMRISNSVLNERGRCVTFLNAAADGVCEIMKVQCVDEVLMYFACDIGNSFKESLR